MIDYGERRHFLHNSTCCFIPRALWGVIGGNKSLVRFGGGVLRVGSVATAVELVAEVDSSGAGVPIRFSSAFSSERFLRTVSGV